jgi:hypothetical protein
MAMTERTIRLDIGRIVFDGIDPGDRRRFEHAFTAACEHELRTVAPRGEVRERIRCDIRLTPGATPERLAGELAHALIDAVLAR